MLCKQIIDKQARRITTVEHKLPVYHKVCGIGWDTMTLDVVDMEDLQRLSPTELHNWFSQMHSRFT